MVCVIAGIVAVMGSDTSLIYGNAVCANNYLPFIYMIADYLSDFCISFCRSCVYHFGCEFLGLPTAIIEAGRRCWFHLVVYDHCKYCLSLLLECILTV
jgi:hypothetical protein